MTESNKLALSIESQRHKYVAAPFPRLPERTIAASLSTLPVESPSDKFQRHEPFVLDVFIHLGLTQDRRLPGIRYRLRPSHQPWLCATLS
jgi:hypothetical protein